MRGERRRRRRRGSIFGGEESNEVGWRERTSQEVTVSLTWESDIGFFIYRVALYIDALGFVRNGGKEMGCCGRVRRGEEGYLGKVSCALVFFLGVIFCTHTKSTKYTHLFNHH